MSQPALLPYDPGALEAPAAIFLCCLLCHTPPTKMSSGIKVRKEDIPILDEMKMPKGALEDRIRLIVMQIVGDSEVQIEKIYREKDVAGEENFFKFVQKQMKDDTCRYYLYDCHFETDLSPKDQLVFIMWTPDDGCIKDKMKYASSWDCVVKEMKGIKLRLQFNDCDEREDICTFAKKLSEGVKSIEGHPLK